MSRQTPAATAMLLLCGIPLVCCSKSEGEQEAAARKAATPVRVEHDGSIKLTAADREALNLEVAPVAAGTLGAGTLRFGKVQSAATDEVIVTAPVSGKISGASAVAGSTVAPATILPSPPPPLHPPDRAT